MAKNIIETMKIADSTIMEVQKVDIVTGRATADCKSTVNARLAPQDSPLFSSQHPVLHHLWY
jgi:hypothetical protein